MSIEATLKGLLGPLVSGRVYPDRPPDQPTFPFVTYQQVGGRALWFTEGAVPDHKHARIQINVWSASRLEANRVARLIEKTICTSELPAEPYGALVASYEEAIDKYGTRQDFGIWYPDP